MGITDRHPLISGVRRGIVPKGAKSMPDCEPEPIRVERLQMSHGRLIHVVSVFPANGTSSPEDKLKKLIDMELKKSADSA